MGPAPRRLHRHLHAGQLHLQVRGQAQGPQLHDLQVRENLEQLRHRHRRGEPSGGGGEVPVPGDSRPRRRHRGRSASAHVPTERRRQSSPEGQARHPHVRRRLQPGALRSCGCVAGRLQRACRCRIQGGPFHRGADCRQAAGEQAGSAGSTESPVPRQREPDRLPQGHQRLPGGCSHRAVRRSRAHGGQASPHRPRKVGAAAVPQPHHHQRHWRRCVCTGGPRSVPGALFWGTRLQPRGIQLPHDAA